MPGITGAVIVPSAAGKPDSGNGAVTIARIADEVAVLPTKTRPKKLQMVGSDGKTYTYLVKVSVNPGCPWSICV